MRTINGCAQLLLWPVLLVLLDGVDRASAQPYLTLYEGPAYDGVSGYQNPSFNDGPVYEPEASWALLNNSGTAAWTAIKPDGDTRRAVRWNPLAGPAMELTPIVTSGNAFARAINAQGTVVGYTHVGIEQRAARWSAGSSSPTVLPGLSPNAERHANGINDAGIAVGNSDFQNEFGNQGQRAVRWNAAAGITQLQNLDFNSQNVAFADANAINGAGEVVGWAVRFGAMDTVLGERAVRWTSGGSISELGHLGTNSNGAAEAEAWAINTAGAAVGYSKRFDAMGQSQGDRAVRWNVGSTAVIELELLGSSDVNIGTHSKAYTLNDAGTAVGWAEKYTTSLLGRRAVLWNAAGDVTELGTLGTNGEGFTAAEAYDINEDGIAVGTALKWGETGSAAKAVYWGANGAAVDLNTLIAPSAVWELTQAFAISDTGWIVGVGQYSPPGPQNTYERVFMLQLPSPATVPGDYNDDGKVDAADYVVWRKSEGTMATLPNDPHGGAIGALQFNTWRANFGSMGGEGAGNSPGSTNGNIPEPAGILMVLIASVAVFSNYRGAV
jgi:hypothetical protein